MVSASQLFLLCAMRAGCVQAKNVLVHDWTIEHETAFATSFNEKSKDMVELEEFMNLSKEMREDLKKSIPVLLPKIRSFYLHKNDMGHDLAEKDGITWYQPGNTTSNEWDYRGKFKLEIPLTEEESFVLEHYQAPPVFPRRNLE